MKNLSATSLLIFGVVVVSVSTSVQETRFDFRGKSENDYRENRQFSIDYPKNQKPALFSIGEGAFEGTTSNMNRNSTVSSLDNRNGRIRNAADVQRNTATPDPNKEKIHEEDLSEEVVIYFIIISLIIGAICVEIKKRTRLPYTPMLLVVGILMGYFSGSLGAIGQSTLKILEIHPHGILLIFIPTLIFESAYNIDPFIVKQQLIQILLLAVPGVAVGAIIIGLFMNIALGYGLEFPISAALTISSIICATDPVAVVALLKEVGAPAKFSTLLEGESLLNDGTAMVFFIIFSSIYKELDISFLGICVKFVQLTLGGVILGFVACILVLFWIKKIIKDDILTANLTLSTCYLTFFVGEFYLGVSGIISIVTLGVLMGNLGKVTMNPESLETVHTILTFLQYVLETLLFVITGCYIGRAVVSGGFGYIGPPDIIRMLIFFPMITFARYLMLVIMQPFINRWGWPITKVDILILTYGGLRGSIALCLALMVVVDDDYSQRFRDLCLFFVISMITFTVLLNGLTMKYVMKKVDFYPKTDAERKVKLHLKQKLIVEAMMHKSLITENRFLKLANWESVMEIAGVRTDLKEITKKKKRVQKYMTIGHDSIKLDLVPKEEIYEARLRVYHQIKSNLWMNFEESLCSTNSMSSLREIIDICMSDIQKPIWIWQCISENFISIEWIQLLGNFNKKFIIGYFSRRFLMSYLLNAYEILFNLVTALGDVFHKKSDLPINKRLVNEVFNEVSSNLESCEEYLFNFINLFPDLATIIQLRQSAKIILNKQKVVLKNAFHNGSINEREFKKLKGFLDKNIRSLEITNVTYDLPKIHALQLVCPLFAKLSASSFRLIEGEYSQDTFEKGALLLRKGKPALMVYIVVSGSCIEEYENSNVRKGVGSAFSFSDIVSPNMIAINNVLAAEKTNVYCIESKKLLEVMQREPEFELSVYRSAFLKFIKNNKEFEIYADATDFHAFVGRTTLEKLRFNQKVLFDKGGFCFAGCLLLPESDENKKIEIDENEMIIPSAYEYLTTKPCIVLRFDKAIITSNYKTYRPSSAEIKFIQRETLADVLKRETDAEIQYQLIEERHFDLMPKVN